VLYIGTFTNTGGVYTAVFESGYRTADPPVAGLPFDWSAFTPPDPPPYASYLFDITEDGSGDVTISINPLFFLQFSAPEPFVSGPIPPPLGTAVVQVEIWEDVFPPFYAEICYPFPMWFVDTDGTVTQSASIPYTTYSNFTITVKDVVFGGTDTVLFINFGSGRSQTPELPVDFICSTDPMYGGAMIPNGGAQASLQAANFPWTLGVTVCVADGPQNIGFHTGTNTGQFNQQFDVFTEDWAGGGTWSGLITNNPAAPTVDTTFTVETVGGSSCC
jgi:hypothetical protein